MMTDSVEVWKVIDNYPMYEVSNHGRVRSWHKTGPAGGRSSKPKLMKPSSGHKGGYLVVMLCNGPCRRGTTVHRLVLETFRPCANAQILDTRHMNGNPKDNRLDNLEWGTRKQNMADMKRHGTVNYGERNGGAKLTTEQVKEIVKRLQDEPLAEIADRYGVSTTAVRKIKSGKKWSHVTGINV